MDIGSSYHLELEGSMRNKGFVLLDALIGLFVAMLIILIAYSVIISDHNFEMRFKEYLSADNASLGMMYVRVEGYSKLING
jgi:hypothetical protein